MLIHTFNNFYNPFCKAMEKFTFPSRSQRSVDERTFSYSLAGLFLRPIIFHKM